MSDHVSTAAAVGNCLFSVYLLWLAISMHRLRRRTAERLAELDRIKIAYQGAHRDLAMLRARGVFGRRDEGKA